MNKQLFLLCLSMMAFTANAQTMVDDFETNQYGWTEMSNKSGIAIIKDGFIRLEAKPGEEVFSTCYAPFDFNKPFTMSVDVLDVGKFSLPVINFRQIGLLLDYEDEKNHIKFYLFRESAVLERVVNGVIVARKAEELKRAVETGSGLKLEVNYTLNELSFRINGIKSLSYRRRLPQGEFMLGTSGIGFYAAMSTKVSFDNLIIEQ